MISWLTRWFHKTPEPIVIPAEQPQFGGAGASGDWVDPTPAKLPRGVRNRNPGNIESGKTKWLGQTGDDGRFCTFVDAHHGMRALAMLLIIYERKYALNTITEVISRWAPGNENNTVAYINSVSVQTGFHPNQILRIEEPATLAALTKAIIRHENGYHPYTDTAIQAAVGAAIRSAA